MKTKCYSVRVESLYSISEKAFKACGFDGSEAILPKSQVFGQDYEVTKSEAYWIAAWILEKKDLQYSGKKIGWYNPEKGNVEPNFEITVEHHVPKKLDKSTINHDKNLER